VNEVDEAASPTGGKGIGEIGVFGDAPAVANAVFRATGPRIRELPILPQGLFGGKLTPSLGKMRWGVQICVLCISLPVLLHNFWFQGNDDDKTPDKGASVKAAATR
jgi:hypothetical protein